MKNILLVLIVSTTLFSCREKIDAGHVGIRVNLYGSDKGVSDVAIVSGSVWYTPWSEEIYEYPTFIQTKNYDPFVVNSKDASEFTVDPTLNYFVQSDKVPSIFKQYRKALPELEEGFIKNCIFDSYRLAANRFTSDSLMSNRERFEELVQNNLRKVLLKDGFIFHNLSSALTPPKSLRNAIDAKNAAIQQAMQIDNEVKRSEAESRKKVAIAQGNAEALVIQARSEAEANRLKQQSITPLLLQQQFIDKWNGVLPVYGEVPKLMKSVQ